MKTKILVMLLVVSLALNVGIISAVGFRVAKIKRWIRGDGEMMPAVPHKRIMRRLGKKFGISKEQAKEIEKITCAAAEEIKPIRIKVREKRKELMDLIRNEGLDEKKKEVLLGEISALHKEMQSKGIDTIIATRKMMSPEQRQKMDSFMEKKFGGHKKHGMGPWGHRSGRKESRREGKKEDAYK